MAANWRTRASTEKIAGDLVTEPTGSTDGTAISPVGGYYPASLIIQLSSPQAGCVIQGPIIIWAYSTRWHQCGTLAAGAIEASLGFEQRVDWWGASRVALTSNGFSAGTTVDAYVIAIEEL